jgi:hypothetical protein
MRTFAVLASALVAVLAVGAGVAGAGKPSTTRSGNFSVLDVEISPPKSSARGRPRGVELTFDSFMGNRLTGGRTPTAAEIKIRFQSGFVFNGPLFPKCRLGADDPSDCPSPSQIGRGSAEIDASPVVPTPFSAEILAYNGRLRDGNQTLLIFAQQGSATLGKFVAELKTEAVGPYRSVLEFDPATVPPGTPEFSITQFRLRTFDRSRVVRQGGRRVRRHFLEAPRRCRGSWAFADFARLENGETLNATDRDSCVN